MFFARSDEWASEKKGKKSSLGDTRREEQSTDKPLVSLPSDELQDQMTLLSLPPDVASNHYEHQEPTISQMISSPSLLSNIPTTNHTPDIEESSIDKTPLPLPPPLDLGLFNERLDICEIILPNLVTEYSSEDHIHLITKNTLPCQTEMKQQTIEESIVTTKSLSKDKQELALQPFTLLDNKKFKAFCIILCPRYKVPCDNTIKIMIAQSVEFSRLTYLTNP
ncbi:2599_t:CDS:2 [Ambispora gerdemannii]|uniref:2599_t:CDS:1 n=1 Tax=Ambispora gerdemannii TaxID=144530 RepID=A0A9N8ZFN2_9GLOM|nr:2599_t:CDS:2 [Ambispora gerdemannii]